jgi:hypothetical protein
VSSSIPIYRTRADYYVVRHRVKSRSELSIPPISWLQHRHSSPRSARIPRKGHRGCCHRLYLSLPTPRNAASQRSSNRRSLLRRIDASRRLWQNHQPEKTSSDHLLLGPPRRSRPHAHHQQREKTARAPRASLLVLPCLQHRKMPRRLRRQ